MAPRQILDDIALEVAKRHRQTVAAMFRRRAAQGPQRVLQPLGEGDEALAAQHDLGVLPAGEGKADVVEPVIERHAGDRHTERAHIGEVG